MSLVTIEHEIAPQPARVGPATIGLRLKDDSGKAVTGAKITIEGNMSHAGMGPTFGRATEIEPGRYQAAIEFSMGGDWIVLLHVTLSDGQKLERQFAVSGVLPDAIQGCFRFEGPIVNSPVREGRSTAAGFVSTTCGSGSVLATPVTNTRPLPQAVLTS